jgi:DNA-binding NtrC family response regulator
MKKVRIDIYFVDNDYNELENFRENFKFKYEVKLYTFSSPEMFLNKLRSDYKRKKSHKIVIIDYLIKSRGMNTTTALELLPKIKAIDKNIEVIIFADSDNIELKATNSKMKPVAFIKKDLQYFIRLDAIISRLISEKELIKKYSKSKIAVLFLIITLLLGVAAISYVALFENITVR